MGPQNNVAVLETENLDALTERLLKDINSMKSGEILRIIHPDLDYEIYGHNQIIESLRKAYEGEVTTKIITGPIVLVNEKGNNGILDLLEEGKVEIYMEDERPHLPLRTLGDKDIYAELPYVILTPKHKIKEFFGPELKDQKPFWRQKFIEYFDIRISDDRIAKPTENRAAFILLSYPQVDKIIKDIAYKTKNHYDEATKILGRMSREDIRKYLFS